LLGLAEFKRRPLDQCIYSLQTCARARFLIHPWKSDRQENTDKSELDSLLQPKRSIDTSPGTSKEHETTGEEKNWDEKATKFLRQHPLSPRWPNIIYLSWHASGM